MCVCNQHIGAGSFFRQGRFSGKDFFVCRLGWGHMMNKQAFLKKVLLDDDPILIMNKEIIELVYVRTLVSLRWNFFQFSAQ